MILVRNTLTKQIIAALGGAPKTVPANCVVEDKPVYGPTAYNRFIVDGRYLAKEVVAQVWDVLTTGEAVDCPNKSAKRAPRKARAAKVAEKATAERFAQVRADIASNRKPRDMEAALSLYEEEKRFVFENNGAAYELSDTDAMLDDANMAEYGMTAEHGHYLAQANLIRAALKVEAEANTSQTAEADSTVAF